MTKAAYEYDKFFVNSIVNFPTKVFFEHFPRHHVEINNCVDAAGVRKIPLEDELKSIVLKIADDFYIFHYRGNERLDSRLIEKSFRTILKIKTRHKFRFATSAELMENFQCAKGKISPVNEKIWNTYAFISPSLINGRIIYTNDGTLTGYVKFDSILLTRSPKNNVSDKRIFFFTKKINPTMRTDAHRSMAGLLDVAYGPEELGYKMKEFYHRAVSRSFSNVHYNAVRIVDTFFSDTIDTKLLLEIVRQSKIQRYRVQIILLNPFTESAAEREKSLPRSENRIKRLNRGLCNIKNAITGTDDTFSNEFMNEFGHAAYIFTQIETINRLKREKDLDFELRFSMIGRLPLIMFGQYACSGQFLDFASSRDTPWYFWVDDPNEQDDQYDNLRKHFESLWKNSCELREIDFREYIQKESERSDYVDMFGLNNRNIFFSYGHDNLTRTSLESVIRQHGFFPVIFDNEKMHTTEERLISNLLKSAFNKCSSAVVIMTKDDILRDGTGRPRPNVLLELGYAQALYGSLVFLLVERGLEIPTNLSGYLFAFFDRDEQGHAVLPQLEVFAFLERIRRVLG